MASSVEQHKWRVAAEAEGREARREGEQELIEGRVHVKSQQ